LFGEKYGEIVRVVTFDKDFSIELCGGTHVNYTGEIGLFKIVSEGAVAAGVRRIEALTAIKADEFYRNQTNLISEVKLLLKNPKDISKTINSILEENNLLQKQLQKLLKEKAVNIKKDLISKIKNKDGIDFVFELIDLPSAEETKNLLFEIRNQFENLFCVVGSEVNGKAALSVILSDKLVKEKNMNANTIVRELSKEIQGGGGGQPFYATAGGTKKEGLISAIKKAESFLNH
ncbi:MAG: DHHA1 domain-containing protein, partial [Bacteroidota bacterium]